MFLDLYSLQNKTFNVKELLTSLFGYCSFIPRFKIEQVTFNKKPPRKNETIL